MNNSLILKYLQTHQLTHDQIEKYIHSDEEINHLFTDSNIFIKQLHANKDKNITIYPDYDADGICGGITAYVGLKILGFNVELYHPKSSLGYGLNIDSIQELLKQYPDTEVILTVDNGISTKDAVDYLYGKNIKVLISDHHTGRNEYFPDKALAVVDPNRSDKEEIYPFQSISGTAVIYKLLNQYAAKYQIDDEDYNDLHILKIFVGISCITDVMPIINENRYFVKESCKLMQQLFNNELYCNNNVLNLSLLGLNRLLFDLMIQGVVQSSDDIDSTLIGFYIGPILNSPRRMHDDSDLAFKLFRGLDVSSDLIELNQNRKQLINEYYSNVDKILNSMKENNLNYYKDELELDKNDSILNKDNLSANVKCFNDKVLVYCAPIKHGLAGLLASKLMNQYLKPTIVMSNDGGGSGRSLGNLSLHDALAQINKKQPELLNKWGGHDMAAGLNTNNIDLFINEFNLQFKDKNLTLDENLYINIDIEDLTIDNVEIANEYFKKLEPYNELLPKPEFILTTTIDLSSVKIMGKDLNHLKFELAQGINAIQWNGNNEDFNIAQLLNMNTITIKGSIEINEFRNNKSIQFMIDDITYDII